MGLAAPTTIERHRGHDRKRLSGMRGLQGQPNLVGTVGLKSKGLLGYNALSAEPFLFASLRNPNTAAFASGFVKKSGIDETGCFAPSVRAQGGDDWGRRVSR